VTKPAVAPWSPDSWKSKTDAQAIAYDPASLETACARLRQLPPLVTSWEIERLKRQLAEAQEGKRFLVQGGDCAETLADCRSPVIANKMKILLQMSLVMIHEGKRPVVRVGRFAGQYAKPRSKAVESRDGFDLPSYFGDLVNRPEFTASARRADPENLIVAYSHAAMTLNFIRSLSAGGFADVHHPEYWELSFFRRAGVPDSLRVEYERTTKQLAEALRFMEALGESSVEELTRVDFYTSHEGLSLPYESCQTRQVPRRDGWYDLTTHFPWIGERTRAIDGAHVEFFRGICNPVGLKVGPSCTPEELAGLCERLNPDRLPGRLTLITRLGADKVEDLLPPLVRAVEAEGQPVVWASDPMHGNTFTSAGGRKTRRFDDILSELRSFFAVHRDEGTWPGGLHIELTGDDVTECLGGAEEILEGDLGVRYTTTCDPRLNGRQALDLAFRVAEFLRS
jgi:3-deoxy-7-phosphoheptulonate synthase